MEPSALIGVVGTLAGTVLGWVLNEISSRGKLNIYFSSWEDEFRHNAHGEMVNSSSMEQTECYSYHLSADLYNSSSYTKIMRNIKVVFKNNSTQLKKCTPKDSNTAQRSGIVTFYDDIGSINIPPKVVISLKLHGGDWSKNGGLDYIWKTNQIFLTYLDEHNKEKSLKIKSENYASYFVNHNWEDN